MSKIVKVKDYYYVGGGFYGSSNEQNMMKEIKDNGPIVVSISPEYTFMFYKNGVFH